MGKFSEQVWGDSPERRQRCGCGRDPTGAAGGCIPGRRESRHPDAATARHQRPARCPALPAAAPHWPGSGGVGRSRSTPWLSPWSRAPCPQPCSGASDRSTRQRTGPSAHSSASLSSNCTSARAPTQWRERPLRPLLVLACSLINMRCLSQDQVLTPGYTVAGGGSSLADRRPQRRGQDRSPPGRGILCSHVCGRTPWASSGSGECKLRQATTETADCPPQLFTNSARTAMSRTALSRPMALALDDDLLSPGTSVFDYGCGRGGGHQPASGAWL